MTQQPDQNVDVMIVGGGPVGLSLAIELGMRGVTCLLIEKNDRVGYNPRAKTTNVRSREHMRRWGIADKLRAASPIPRDYPSHIVFATRLNGPLLAHFENAFSMLPERNNLYSEEAQWVPQYVVENVLREHASSLPGVTIRFGNELLGFEQKEAGVTATVRDVASGENYQVASSYLVGADGARSLVREQIGARMTGDGGSMRNLNVVVRLPGIDKMHKHGPAVHYWLINEDVPSLMGPMDKDDLWYFIATKIDPELDYKTIDYCDLIRRATGLDLPMEIIGVDPWVARSLVADFYRKDRVFLAGDACHLHPPFGGFGMNMGIGDAVDLGWKMAATLQGWGGGELLASYEAERRPVHERTIAEALENYRAVSNQLVQPGLEDPGPLGDATRREVGDIILATKVREFRTLGVILGYRYDGSPIVVPDGTSAPEQSSALYIPSACPGSLAPHLWLADGSSLYDHFGQGYTLLVTNGDMSCTGALVEAAKARNIPLTLISPQDDRLAWRYQAPFALIRPDQHVAWRGELAGADVGEILDCVTGRS